MASWDGHKPGTSAVLLELLTTAHTGRTRFSRAQRALFTACEFWAASQNGSLLGHLGEAVESRLLAAETSFDVIGLPKTANILKHARCTLAVDAPKSTQQVIEQIEKALSTVDEPIDHALELYAQRELSGP